MFAKRVACFFRQPFLFYGTGSRSVLATGREAVKAAGIDLRAEIKT